MGCRFQPGSDVLEGLLPPLFLSAPVSQGCSCFPLSLPYFSWKPWRIQALSCSHSLTASFPSKYIPLPGPTGAKAVSCRNFQCGRRCHLLPSFPVSFSAAFFLVCYPAASALYVLTMAKKSSKIRKWSPFLQQ